MMLAVAVIMVDPVPVLDAIPVIPTTATAGSDEVHVTWVVTSWVVESLNVAVALYCTVLPRDMF